MPPQLILRITLRLNNSRNMSTKLNLTRDLVFFDVETTGLNVLRDRILQIALIKYPKNGDEPKELSMLINPSIPIALDAMAIHGITPKDLANKPTFGQVAQQLFDFIGNADLGGYNAARFDIPMLMEEFARVGLEFDVSKRRIIDAQRIFYKMEPRTLKAALRFYCQKELEDAHDALADVRATVDVFKGQLAYYEGKDLYEEEGKVIETPIKNDMQVIHDFTNDLNTVDVTNRLKYDHKGDIVFNFGKYQGQLVSEVLQKDKQYYHWIQEKEFSAQVKQIVKRIKNEK
jgi:DNA polymerase III subunit epsilon